MYTVSKEGGRKEFDKSTLPDYMQIPLVAPIDDHEEVVQVSSELPPDSYGPDDDDAHHMINWLEAMRGREESNAVVGHGFSHFIVFTAVR